MKQAYLGDGVYCKIDLTADYPVTLSTGTHVLEDADAVIYLERSATVLLIKLLEDALDSESGTKHV